MPRRLRNAVIADGNAFDSLPGAVRVCLLGRARRELSEVGGQYRRDM